VDLWNRSREGLDRAEALIKSNQTALVASGHLTPEESEAQTGRISATTDSRCFESAAFVIESIAENMGVKKDFFRDIVALVPEDCVIVTNTSGLSVTELGSVIHKPERFAGMHWVNPPHLIPLVEVIKGEWTAGETVEFVYNLALRLGKKPILAKDVPGFVMNRLQFAVLREALSLVESGAAEIEDIDGAMKYGLGFRYACLGPFETADLGGVDIFYKIAGYLFADLEDRKDVPEMLKALVDDGACGVKSGRGFYDYSGEKAREAMENRDRRIMTLFDALYGN
jgi:3-hydroxybutyryl-CoA dehydrogenase